MKSQNYSVFYFVLFLLYTSPIKREFPMSVQSWEQPAPASTNAKLFSNKNGGGVCFVVY